MNLSNEREEIKMSNLSDDLTDGTTEIYKKLKSLDKEYLELKIQIARLNDFKTGISYFIMEEKLTSMEDVNAILDYYYNDVCSCMEAFQKFKKETKK